MTTASGGYSSGFYQSATAQAAAERMAARGVVGGEPACTMASVGTPDYSMIPARAKGKPIGVGTAGGYTCLIWSTG